MTGGYKNYFSILGVAINAPDEEITAAFNKKIAEHLAGLRKVEDPRPLLEEVELITEAYDHLHDPVKRNAHTLVITSLKAATETPVAPVNQGQTPEVDTKSAATKPGDEPNLANEHPPENENIVSTQPVPPTGQTTSSADEPPVNLPVPSVPEPEYEEVENHAGLAELRNRLPKYLHTKKDHDLTAAEYRHLKTEPQRKPFGVALFVLYCLLLGSLGWLLYGFVNNGDVFGNKAKKQEAVQDSINARVRDSIAKETIDSSLLEDINGTFIVTAERTYFYKKPLEGKRSDYPLLKGYTFTATKKYKDFIYTVFESRFDKTVSEQGWVPIADIRSHKTVKTQRKIEPVVKNYKPYVRVFRDSTEEE